MTNRNVIGCMTGTSMDAIDAALVAVKGAGLDLRTSVRRCVTHSLGALCGPLRRLAAGEPTPASAIAGLAHDLASLHISALRELVRDEHIDLIAVHGQTIFHAPPLSWQLCTPSPLAEAFQAPVVFDLRAADLAAGGQGAPITPLADYVLLGDDAESRAVINLGGFANYTLLPPRGIDQAAPQAKPTDNIRGGDICVCNQLLDVVARDLFSQPFDQDGRHAAAGDVHADIRDDLASLLRGQASQGRSLGTGDELAGWIEQHRSQCPANDLARSACEALGLVIAGVIGNAARAYGFDAIDRILVAGGGVKNRVLLAAIANYSPANVQLTDEFGVPASHREAAAMAVLGALCQDGVPITLPQVTGVRAPAPLAGVWILPSGRSPNL